MADQNIIVLIKPDGTIEVSVEGVIGHDCKNLTKEIEKSIGKTIKEQKTSEYYKTTKNRNINKTKQ
jgi:acylphosphatase